MTQAHGNQSFRYKLKQWNYTKILITSSKICNWTRKTFWVNILRSLSHERENYFHLTGINLYQNDLYQNNFLSKWLVTKLTDFQKGRWYGVLVEHNQSKN